MNCSTCNIQMNVETEMKENGFWFQWYKCPQCTEGYLHKSISPQQEEQPSLDPSVTRS